MTDDLERSMMHVVTRQLVVLEIGLGLALGAACAAPEATEPALQEVPALVDGAVCRVSVLRAGNTEERSYRWDQGKRAITVRGPGSTTFVHTLDEHDNRTRYEVFDQQAPVLAEAFTNRYDGDRLLRVEYLGRASQVPVLIDTLSYDDAGRVRELDSVGVEPMTYLRVTTTGGYRPDGRLESKRLRVENRNGQLVTLLTYDDEGRLIGMTEDGNPYFSWDADGEPDRRVQWTYDQAGRITKSRSEGTLSDVVSVDGDAFDQVFSAGCHPFQARFPSIFDQPSWHPVP